MEVIAGSQWISRRMYVAAHALPREWQPIVILKKLVWVIVRKMLYLILEHVGDCAQEVVFDT